MIFRTRDYSLYPGIVWFLRGVLRIFLIFHVAIPLIIFELPLIKKRFKFNRLALIIGSLFPDIIDKSMLFLNLGSGRGISHTILFILLSFTVLHMAAKRKSFISLPFLIGMVTHLILDLPEVPLFFPFIEYDFLMIEDPLSYWFYKLFNDPLVYLTEIGGILILLLILVGNKLSSVKDIWDYINRNADLVDFKDK
ncbi:MAG: metal-dependent hydrolase [Promethearchaeota archaeon]|nr:MAG: metal-dependent hydrolase [Candidatus Lokiarchaeota archaeon]